MQIRNTFPKEEHLYGEVVVERLYAKGTSFYLYPYRAVYLLVDDESLSVRCLVSAPKKRFHHAVDRNRIKRQMREAYRKNKHSLVASILEKSAHLHIGIHYVGQKLEPSAFMEKKMVALLSHIEKKIKEEYNGR